MAQVTVSPSGHQFQVEEGESVLTAALRQGVMLPYGCKNGACGSCKGKIVSGSVDYGHYHARVLSEAEREHGKALFCQAKPLGDLVIECRTIGAVKDIAVKTLPCRIQKIEKPAPDVALLWLKLPANERLQFLAGQYIDFLLKGGERRSFSMATPPYADEFIELHVFGMMTVRTFEKVVLTQRKNTSRAVLRATEADVKKWGGTWLNQSTTR